MNRMKLENVGMDSTDAVCSLQAWQLAGNRASAVRHAVDRKDQRIQLHMGHSGSNGKNSQIT